MIYYDGQLVDYNNTKLTDEITSRVRKEMNDINENFFGKNAVGYAILRYPKGARKKDEISGLPYPAKPFPVFHKSADKMWVYAKRKKSMQNGKEDYGDAWTIVRDPYMIQKKDAEFLWFLKNHSSDVKAKLLIIENLEEQAAKQANTMADDAYIRYMIYDKRSPISKNTELFQQIGIAIGMKDVTKIGFNQLKNAVYGLVSEGEKTRNRFVNFDVFEKLTNGQHHLKTAHAIKEAINDGTLKFNSKDYKWYLAVGGEFIEPLYAIKLQDSLNKEELLLEAVLNDVNLRGAIFSALGRSDYESVGELRELTKQTLAKMASNYGLDVVNTDSGEKLVEKLCVHMNIPYKARS